MVAPLSLVRQIRQLLLAILVPPLLLLPVLILTLLPQTPLLAKLV